MAPKTKANLSDEAKKVLTALADQESPLANKQIAAQTGLDSKKVSAVVKKLKAEGLVDSPARCKYGLTDGGKTALSD